MFGLKLIVDVFGVLCELVIIRYFFTSLMDKPIVSADFFYIINGACLILLSITTLIPDFQWVALFSNFALIYSLSFLFRKKWYVKIFFSVILYILFAFSEAIVGALSVLITNIDIGNVQDDFLVYTMGLLASKLLVFFFIKIIGYLRPGVYKNMPLKVFLGLMLTPISSIVAIYTIGINLQHYEGWQIMMLVLSSAILLCISNFFVFYLFENQMESEQTKAKLVFAEKQISLQINYYKDMSQRQSEIRKLSHDMKHYLSGLLGFIQEENWSEAKLHIERAVADLADSDSVFDTGHPAVDAILRLKKKRMDSLNIRFDSYIALPKQISVDVLDLCVILGNGLDNAMEACEKLSDEQERYIRLAVRLQTKYISIAIENPTDKLEKYNKSMRTTKSDHFYHGLGLESIRSLTDKYDGSLSIDAANHVFKLAVMVKNG
ncbi:MAG: GHKL domain-containing protein [Oscillospiraceae bacterium]|jgi:hypothetical protein|nr:GHKL domain-containing protein [Oscillospiraceae bacterium]